MIREPALKIVMILVGLLFVGAIYPIASMLRHADPSDYGDGMMLSLYFTLGIFLLFAVRNPAAHRSLIAFTAWSSFAHAIVMSTFSLHDATMRTGFLTGSAVLVAIGILLLAFAPTKSPAPPE